MGIMVYASLWVMQDFNTINCRVLGFRVCLGFWVCDGCEYSKLVSFPAELSIEVSP